MIKKPLLNATQFGEVGRGFYVSMYSGLNILIKK